MPRPPREISVFSLSDNSGRGSFAPPVFLFAAPQA